MSRSDQISKVLKSLAANTADVEAAAVIDNDGLMLSSAMPQDMDDDSVAAMSAAMLGLGERISSVLDRGAFETVMVRASEGYVLITRCGPDAVMSVLTRREAKLGLIFFDVNRAAKEISRLLD